MSDSGATHTGTAGTDDGEELPPPKTTVSITVDGRPHEALPGQLVIEACEDAGVYVPRFCYHPRMSPVGMCRQCLVEVEGPRGPMLVVSCMTTVADGQVVHASTPTVKRAQEGVLELLLANHPLDCPVCDKGGECPLQDQAFTHGPGESRYVEEKRHFEKPIPLSDLVLLDRERCILCDRCTRFADEVAGDRLIHFISRGNTTQVNTFPDEPFASYFSGNTVQICPVGALTSVSYRFKARPWDLDQTETTCTTCSVGCRMIVQSSRDQVVRYLGVDSDPVNWGWLCDRGRYDYDAVNSEARLREPQVRTGERGDPAGMATTTWGAALAAVAQLVRDATDAGGPGSIAVLGGARGTNEDAYAWARLAHDVIGTPHVDAQLADGLPLDVPAATSATIDDVGAARTVVLLGPDLKEELPVLYLRVRDAAQRRSTRVLELTTRETGLTAYAWRSVRHEPGQQVAALRQALADPEVTAQLATGPVVVVVGRANLAEHPSLPAAALRAFLDAVPSAGVLPVLRRGNVNGALRVGMRPGEGGLDSHGILHAAAEGRIELLVLVGADPLADVPDAELARRAMAGARRIVSVDTHPSASTRLADVVLPASAFGEKRGTTTNVEGRVTRVSQQVTARGTSRPDWMIAAGVAAELGSDLGWAGVGDVTAAIAEGVPALAAATPSAMASARDGVVAAAPPGDGTGAIAPAVPARNSYDFRLVVSRKLYDAAVGTQMTPHLAPLAPGAAAHLHPLDLERVGVAPGADVKLSSPRASVVMPAAADPAVLRGTVWVPFNQPGGNVGELIDLDAAVTDVRIESLR